MKRNLVECCDQLTMRKDNYAYFVTKNGTPRETDQKLLKNVKHYQNSEM